MTDWLQARQAGLGGSDIAAIFGTSPWNSALTLWALKTGKQEAENLDHKEFIEWGNRLEDPIIEAYWERTQRLPATWQDTVTEDEECPFHVMELDHNGETKLMLRSRAHPWALATPDGMIKGYQPLPWSIDSDEQFSGCGILEGKTTNSFKKGDWSHGPPPYYMLQAQHYMLVTGLQWASFAVLIGGQELKIFDVPRDDGIIQSIIEKAGKFWEVNIKQDIAPEASGIHNEAALLSKLFPGEDDGEPLTLPEQAMAQMDAIDLLADRIKPIRESLKELERKQTACKNNLKMMMGNASIGHTPDGLLRITYRMTRRAGYTVEAKQYRTMRTKRVRTS